MFGSLGHCKGECLVSAVRLKSFKLQKYSWFATWPDVISNRCCQSRNDGKVWAKEMCFGRAVIRPGRKPVGHAFAVLQLIKLACDQKVEMCFESGEMAWNRRRKHTHGTPRHHKTLGNDVFCPNSNSPYCASMANTFFVCFGWHSRLMAFCSGSGMGCDDENGPRIIRNNRSSNYFRIYIVFQYDLPWMLMVLCNVCTCERCLVIKTWPISIITLSPTPFHLVGALETWHWYTLVCI